MRPSRDWQDALRVARALRARGLIGGTRVIAREVLSWWSELGPRWHDELFADPWGILRRGEGGAEGVSESNRKTCTTCRHATVQIDADLWSQLREEFGQ